MTRLCIRGCGAHGDRRGYRRTNRAAIQESTMCWATGAPIAALLLIERSKAIEIYDGYAPVVDAQEPSGREFL
jgi:hypothetical protein